MVRDGKTPVDPDPSLDHAANLLWCMTGEKPSELAARVMCVSLVLYAEHDFNASTFSARVIASTMSDMHSAVCGAIGALKGPLHGGANQRVMEMLEGIGSPDDVEEYIEGLLARRERIMGFGHRVYKTEDPRARHLRKYSEDVCGGDVACHPYYVISRRIEQQVKKKKGIYPNVDFYSATVQHALGIPVEYYTTLFAASRIAGWTAHVMEQHADNRLMRPRSQFIGKIPRRYVPIE